MVPQSRFILEVAPHIFRGSEYRFIGCLRSPITAAGKCAYGVQVQLSTSNELTWKGVPCMQVVATLVSMFPLTRT